MYVSMHMHVFLTYRRLDINRNGYLSCSWSAEQRQTCYSLSPFVPENSVSWERLARVSPLNLHMQ